MSAAGGTPEGQKPFQGRSRRRPHPTLFTSYRRETMRRDCRARSERSARTLPRVVVQPAISVLSAALVLTACGGSAASLIPLGNTDATIYWSWAHNPTSAQSNLTTERFSGTVGVLKLAGSATFEDASSQSCDGEFVESVVLAGHLGPTPFHLEVKQCPATGGVRSSNDSSVSGTVGNTKV